MNLTASDIQILRSVIRGELVKLLEALAEGFAKEAFKTRSSPETSVIFATQGIACNTAAKAIKSTKD